MTQQINLSGTCMWHYYERCDKSDCVECRNYKNVQELLNRGRENEKQARESRLAHRILDFSEEDR